MKKWNRFHLKLCYAVCYTLETGKGMSLVLSNACIVMILYLALSFCTPSSLYARYLPSLSLILGDVRGGPPGEPHSFVGGGWRIAWNAQPRSTIGRTKTNLGAILSRSGAFRWEETNVKIASSGKAHLQCRLCFIPLVAFLQQMGPIRE